MNGRIIPHEEQVLDVLEFLERRAPERVARLDEQYPEWRNGFVCRRGTGGLEDEELLWAMWLVAKRWLSNNPKQ